jgi:hypothetical protein
MKGHSHQQLMGGDFESPTLAGTPLAEESGYEGDAQQLGEELAEEMCRDDRGFSHPQFIEQTGKKYQVYF